MAKTTSIEKYTRSLATGSNSLAQETLTAVTADTPMPPLSVAAKKNTSSQSTQHENWAKKAESAEIVGGPQGY